MEETNEQQERLNELNRFNFNAFMLNVMLKKTMSEKIDFTEITGWHASHPYLRLNIYNGIQMSQVLGVYLALNPTYISQFDTIIEIGTYNGGLTSWLYDNKKTNAMVVSYDIDGTINHTGRTDIDFRVEDCFEKKAFNDIISYIQRPGKTLVVCDGGDKPKEFNVFSEYLKSGDNIIAHDYSAGPDMWKLATDYWQWPYASDTNYDLLKDAVIKNGLEPYRNEEFNFYLWTSYVKK
jgi:hypothetical protein